MKTKLHATGAARPRATAGRWAVAIAMIGVGVLPATVTGAGASEPHAALAECRAVRDGAARLACYDALADDGPAPAAGTAGSEAGRAPDDAPSVPAHSALAVRWELDPGTAGELFRPRGHEPTYLVPAHWTSSVNRAPFTTLPPDSNAADGRIQSVEAKFQLSFKLKMAADVLGTGGNLWAGYTQQSYWQVYNAALSRPFRETDYQPELIWSQPVRFAVAGFTGRLVNVGLLHQSNGRADPLSRSWNRVYLDVGLERGRWALYVRPWIRLPDSTDDNPGIERFVGRAQLRAVWKRGEESVTFAARNSFSGAWHGSGEIDWVRPIVGGLRGYVQLFSGYGESIIDYNHRQTTVSTGILISDWL